MMYYRHELEKYPIFAMADTKSNIAAKLDDSTLQIVRQITKLCLYPNHVAANYWKHEIFNFLHSISLIKRKNRLPDKRFILKSTIEISEKFLHKWIENVRLDYGEPQIQLYDEDIIDRIHKYYDWLSDELSNYGDIARIAIYNKLDEITRGDC